MKIERDKIKEQIAILKEELVGAKEHNEPSGTLSLLEKNIKFLEDVIIGIINFPDVNSILDKISRVDLTKFPYDELQPLISKLGMVPIMSKFLHPGHGLIRARPYNKGEKTFTQVSDLSFKPAEYNSTYQRASTPRQTAFYGCIANSDKYEADGFDGRLSGTLESVPWIFDDHTNRIQRIAHGRWDTIQIIRLNSVIQHKDFHRNNPLMKEMYDDFNNFLNLIPEMKASASAIADFFAEKFADKDASSDNSHLYILSAMWTEASISAGLDGVFYPSVRSDGDNFCVALSPHSCSKLSLSVAGESTIYKYKKQVVIANELICSIPNGEKTFNMLPVEAKYRFSNELILQQLGLENFDELEDLR